jgi:hypothetical protein
VLGLSPSLLFLSFCFLFFEIRSTGDHSATLFTFFLLFSLFSLLRESGSWFFCYCFTRSFSLSFFFFRVRLCVRLVPRGFLFCLHGGGKESDALFFCSSFPTVIAGTLRLASFLFFFFPQRKCSYLCFLPILSLCVRRCACTCGCVGVAEDEAVSTTKVVPHFPPYHLRFFLVGRRKRGVVLLALRYPLFVEHPLQCFLSVSFSSSAFLFSPFLCFLISFSLGAIVCLFVFEHNGQVLRVAVVVRCVEEKKKTERGNWCLRCNSVKST